MTPAQPALPVIVGAGLAGLITAIELCPQPCIVLTTGEMGTHTATGWAQGGIAAAFGADDSPALHARDTLISGAGLCDADIVEAITAAAPAAVLRLEESGAHFDRGDDGALRLGLEGAHCRRRIVHAGGDGSGAEILRSVVETARATPSITVREHTRALRILTAPDDGSVLGLEIETPAGPSVLPTDAVILATGGYGALWQHTSNPLGARGQGVAMAARAGARLRDLEMAQFHPTSLDAGLDPMPLISEAVRGEGAVLIDRDGKRLPGNHLASRDIVSRAVWTELTSGGQVFLDARVALGERFADVFPGIDRACRSAGVNPTTDPIPVHPAAHYQCGGVEVDRHGRTCVPGLWAVGEVASTGLHGANRLASNSLLEAVVCAGWVAHSLRHRHIAAAQANATLAAQQRPAVHPHDSPESRNHLRILLSKCAGVVRTEDHLMHAIDTLEQQMKSHGIDDLTDHALMALLICHSALSRRESRGGHLRSDYPHTDPEGRHTAMHIEDLQAPVGVSR